MLYEANMARKKIAEENEWYLYNYISKKPGLSLYQLSKNLNWSTGKIQYYINSLLEQGLIINSTEIINGRTRKIFRPKSLKEFVKEIEK
ncbi:MAG: winged helix-turn-helix transcriptional regulator [Candidatus Helarchaeota archaeon]